MNPLWHHLIGVLIILMMLTFIGIWVWAWNRRHVATFDQLARLPMNDEGESPSLHHEKAP